MITPIRVLLAASIVAFAVPAPANAQIKSLLKKKAAAQVTGEEKAADTKSPKAGPQFGGDLVELAGPVLDDFIAAHDLENRLIRNLRKEIAALKPPEEFESCSRNVAMTPEAQKIVMAMANLPEKATMEDVQKVTEKMNREMLALIKAKCGVSRDEVWPQYKRSQEIARFRKVASLAFDSALDARAAARPRGGPSVGESAWVYQEPSGKYPLSDERVIVFCRLKDAGKLTRDQRGFWWGEGSGAGNYYIYSDDEYDDLSKKCKQLEHEEEAG